MYENLIAAEEIIKKLDRQFRKVVKWESRKYVDPENHGRREARMLKRAAKRWEGSYSLYSGNLTEEEQQYRDYFETDLIAYPEDERVEEFLDKQELLTDPRYSLQKFDFQESYVLGVEDDQTSYAEKQAFKFKYRRALDSAEDYERRNRRMVERQKERFASGEVGRATQEYLEAPEEREGAYLKAVAAEGAAQYRDYFESEDQSVQSELFSQNPEAFAAAYENWAAPLADKSTLQTFPLPQWDRALGFWPNALALLREASTLPRRTHALHHSAAQTLLHPNTPLKK